MWKIEIRIAGKPPVDYLLHEHGARTARPKTFETREAAEVFAVALRAQFPATRYEVIEAA